MKRHTKIFALTGNIGTGKSTVAWIFEELSVPVIDSDELAHEAISPHLAAWRAIFEKYGSSILLSDSVIDRKALAQIIFNNPSERKFLESVIHPYVKEQISHKVANFAKDEIPFVIVEVPLLFEAGWEKDFDAVIAVKCDEEEEIRRCMDKFDFGREEVLLRLGAQYPLQRKINASHAVIDNSGSIEETKVQVKRLYQDMLSGRFPKPSA